MLKKERQALIQKEINIHNRAQLSDLAEMLNVSEDTVRRDLQELSDAGKIIKVRGGALSKSYHAYSYRENDIYAYQEKTIIAQKAISLLRDDMLVLISGGSTNLEIARILPPDLRVIFLTVSVTTAMQLLDHPNCETIFLGGQLSRTAKISVGGDVVAQLNQIKPDLCLLGTNALDVGAGLTDADWEVVTVKRAMIRAASKTALLSISEKLGTVQKIRICELHEVDMLITELDPGHELLQPYAQAGLRLV